MLTWFTVDTVDTVDTAYTIETANTLGFIPLYIVREGLNAIGMG